MKVHQPNLPSPEFQHMSLSKLKYADSVVEPDARIGNVMSKLRELGLDKNTPVFYTTDKGEKSARNKLWCFTVERESRVPDADGISDWGRSADEADVGL